MKLDEEKRTETPSKYDGRGPVDDAPAMGIGPSEAPQKARRPSEPAAPLGTRPVRAWLFDVDGVLTDPSSKALRHPAIVDELVARLRRGEPVGFNTGRSLAFVEDALLAPIEAAEADVALLRLVFVCAEKGVASLVYDEDGAYQRRLDTELTVARLSELREQVAALIMDRYAGVMFLDRSKVSMVTVEMMDNVDVDAFRRRQVQIFGELECLLRRCGLASQVRVDPTRIAVDIEHPGAGKALGTRKFVQFVRERGLTPIQYVAFGDSPSDLEMAVELHRLGLRVEFVFAGAGGDVRSDASLPFRVTLTETRHDDGTLEYLRQHS